jgi:hypothetical protein
VAAAGEDEKEEVIQMPRGRGFGWRGFGWGLGWGPGWGRGNPYPFCRWFPWLPRWWWAYPYAYGMGSYTAGTPYGAGVYPTTGTPYGAGVYPTAGMPYGAGMYPTAGAPYYSPYSGYPTW